MKPTPAELADSPWFHEWVRVARRIPQDGIDWMRSRPEPVKAVMRVLPPSCVVRALSVGCADPTWRCSCGWSGKASGLSAMPDGSRVCPNKDSVGCRPGGLVSDDGWERGLGIVSSIFEDGTITVRESPTAAVRHRAHRECVEVVGYFNGLTPAKMVEILA